MPFIPKLQTALGLVFILTAGAISVRAQTRVAVDSSSIKSTNKATTTAAPTSEPQKAELAETSTAPAENPAESVGSEKTAAISRRASYENPFKFPAAPIAKPAAFTGTEVPRSPQGVDPDKWQFLGRGDLHS